jgi:FkbM family methyltransferase
MNTHDLLLNMENDWLENEFRRLTQVMQRDASAVCRVFGKQLIEIDPDDLGCSTHLAMNGYWEMPVTRAIARNVKPKSVCIDVGSNVGYFTVLLAAVMGCQVMAMEPQKSLRSLLYKTCCMNGIGAKVILRSEAAGATIGQVWLVQDCSTANAKIVALPQEHENATLVEITPIDLFSIPVDFVKIDAEGYEPEVIAGMQNTIASNPGLQVCLEFTPRMYQHPGVFLASLHQDFLVMRIRDDGSLEIMDEGDTTVLDAPEFEMLWLRRRA